MEKQTSIEFEEQPGYLLGFEEDDGGRSAAGYKGSAGDCATRALSIILYKLGYSGNPAETYQIAYDHIFKANKEHYNRKRKKRRKKAPSARDSTYKKVTRQVMEYYGGVWTPTMEIGSGCKVHLRSDELPGGLLVVSVSKHVTAVINHVIRDTYNPDRNGTRCVYGYWKFD